MSQAYQAGLISGMLIGSMLIPIGFSRLLLWLAACLKQPMLRLSLVHGFVLSLYILKLLFTVLVESDANKLLLSMLSCAVCLLMLAYDLLAVRRKWPAS